MNDALQAATTGIPVSLSMTIRNVNRAVGTLTGSAITRTLGAAPLANDHVTINFEGSSGQSLGAFMPAGMTLRLTGDANDYAGKGLSGGRIVISPPTTSTFRSDENIIAGNVIGYGATSG